MNYNGVIDFRQIRALLLYVCKDTNAIWRQNHYLVYWMYLNTLYLETCKQRDNHFGLSCVLHNRVKTSKHTHKKFTYTYTRSFISQLEPLYMTRGFIISIAILFPWTRKCVLKYEIRIHFNEHVCFYILINCPWSF